MKKCLYCGNNMPTHNLYQDKYVVNNMKYCSDRCKWLKTGIEAKRLLGLFLSDQEMLIKEFTDQVSNKYVFIPYNRMFVYVNKGIPHSKKIDGDSGDELAEKILYAMQDLSPSLLLFGERIDYRLLLTPGLDAKSSLQVPGGRGTEMKRGIQLTGDRLTTFGRELVNLEGKYHRNQREGIPQTKYTVMGHKLYSKLANLYKDNQDKISLVYGDDKVFKTLLACGKKELNIDSASAFALAGYLKTYKISIDYRLLLEPLSPSQVVIKKNRL